jgi:hypothetical protein
MVATRRGRAALALLSIAMSKYPLKAQREMRTLTEERGSGLGDLILPRTRS